MISINQVILGRGSEIVDVDSDAFISAEAIVDKEAFESLAIIPEAPLYLTKELRECLRVPTVEVTINKKNLKGSHQKSMNESNRRLNIGIGRKLFFEKSMELYQT